MHIVFDARIHMDYMSGMSRYILMTLQHLFEIDSTNKYTILLNNTLKEDNPIFKFSEKGNVTLITTPFVHMGPKAYFQLPRFIRSLNPDVYHYPHIDIPFTGVPCVSNIFDSNIGKGVKRHKDFLGLKDFYMKLAIWNTLKNSDNIIFITESMKKEILKDFNVEENSNNHKVVYCGIEENFNNIDVLKVEETVKKYSLSKPYFFYAGALREHKNIKRLIESFVNAENEGYELILVGSKYEKYPVNLNYPNVRHLGMVDDNELKHLYHRSFAFLFPSLLEGFGLPIIEAMSFGKPVITSNFGATKEVGGNAALLVNPLDVNEITEAINSLIKNENTYREHTTKGKERANEFSWVNAAKQTLEIYETLNKNSNK